MSKYIVRNCKALISNDICELYSQKGIHLMTYCYCKDTNCVIKQVIEKCKKRSSKCERCKASEDYQPTDCLDYCSNDDVIFANEILQLFDIEEISE